MEDNILCDNEWLQLRILKDPPLVNGYVYSHEKRCDGQIVAILPYRIVNDTIELLFRLEDTPCWSKENFPDVCPCSFTGGVDPGMNPLDTAVKELAEESGYVIDPADMKALGICKGSKSSDSTYHLFTCDLTNYKSTQELHIESEHEKMSGYQWINIDDAYSDLNLYFKDPMVAACLLRLHSVFGY